MGESIIEWKAGEPLMDIQVSVRQLPYPEYSSNGFLIAASGLLPFVLVLSLIYSAGIFTKVHILAHYCYIMLVNSSCIYLHMCMQELVLEKESRIRELLLITGLKQWVLWSAWYIKQLVFLLAIALVLSVMLKVCT